MFCRALFGLCCLDNLNYFLTWALVFVWVLVVGELHPVAIYSFGFSVFVKCSLAHVVGQCKLLFDIFRGWGVLGFGGL